MAFSDSAVTLIFNFEVAPASRAARFGRRMKPDEAPHRKAQASPNSAGSPTGLVGWRRAPRQHLLERHILLRARTRCRSGAGRSGMAGRTR